MRASTRLTIPWLGVATRKRMKQEKQRQDRVKDEELWVVHKWHSHQAEPGWCLRWAARSLKRTENGLMRKLLLTCDVKCQGLILFFSFLHSSFWLISHLLLAFVSKGAVDDDDDEEHEWITRKPMRGCHKTRASCWRLVRMRTRHEASSWLLVFTVISHTRRIWATFEIQAMLTTLEAGDLA